MINRMDFFPRFLIDNNSASTHGKAKLLIIMQRQFAQRKHANLALIFIHIGSYSFLLYNNAANFYQNSVSTHSLELQYQFQMEKDSRQPTETNNEAHSFDRKYNHLTFSALVDDSISYLAKHTIVATYSSKTQYFFKFLWPLHSFFGYLLLAEHPLSSKMRQIVAAIQNAGFVYRTLQTLLYSLNIILIITILRRKQKTIANLTDTLFNAILKNFSILSRINLFLTAFLLYFNLRENLFAMIIATFVTVLQSTFIENCCLKKEENYLTSPLTAIILRFIIIANILANCIIVHKALPSTNFCQSLAIFAVITLVWYLKAGKKLFIHRLPKSIMLLASSMTIALGIQSLLIIMHQQTHSFFDFLEWLIAFFIVSAYLFIEYEARKQQTVGLGGQHFATSLKEYEYVLNSVQEEADYDADKNTALIGLLHCHQLKKCNNPRCWTNTSQLYDPFLKNNFKESSLTKQKDSALKFYLKCLYETALEGNKSKQMMIDYCEFMISEFGDYSTHCLYLAELISSYDLSLLEKIKVYRLRVLLEELSVNFNKSLFGGRVQLLSILNADIHFNQIMQEIGSYCQQNVRIWQNFNSQTIDLSEIRLNMERNIEILGEIDEKWKKIASFFYVQRHWKQAYLNYYLYLKNLRLKGKQLDNGYVGRKLASYHHLYLVQRQAIFNDKMSDSIFFDKESVIFLTKMVGNSLIFSKIGKSFRAVLHYSQQEVIGSSLNLIVPARIQDDHQQKFITWLQTGQSANQRKYYGKITDVVSKQGIEFQALVFYKIYVCLSDEENLINFACLINTNEENKTNPHSMTRKRSYYQNTSLGQAESLEDECVESLNLQMNLSQQTNIFMKDEQLQPLKHNPQITSVIAALRAIVLFFFVFSTVTGFIFYNGIVNIQQKADYLGLWLTLYRYPIGLTTNYLCNYLNISNSATNSTKINNQIASMTAQLQQAVRDPNAIKILSDDSLNKPENYSAYSPNNINQGIVYDQIDLFYVIYSSLIELSAKKSIKSSTTFLQLDSYLKPSYDTLANRTKLQFHYMIQNEIAAKMDNEKYYVFGLAGVVLVAVAIACYKVNDYFRKMRELMDIIVQFDPKYAKKSMSYWKVIQNKFKYLHLSYLQGPNLKLSAKNLESRIKTMSDCIDFIVDQKSSLKKRIQEAKLTQKRKHTFLSRTNIHSMTKVNLTIILALAIISISLIVLKVTNISQLSNLQQFQNEGYYILRHYPNNQIVGYGLLSRFYSQTFPNETVFQSERFLDAYSTFFLISQYDYKAVNSVQSEFYQKYKAYFFGNPCLANPSILQQADFTLAQCLTWGRNSFSNGIGVYMRYIQRQVGNYLGILAKRTLRKEEMMTLSSGLSLTAYFIEDLINTWFLEFDQRAERFKRNALFGILLVGLTVLVVHLVIFEGLLFSHLQKDYACLQKVYQSFVPEEILIREKVIKQELYVTGIIG